MGFCQENGHLSGSLFTAWSLDRWSQEAEIWTQNGLGNGDGPESLIFENRLWEPLFLGNFRKAVKNAKKNVFAHTSHHVQKITKMTTQAGRAESPH